MSKEKKEENKSEETPIGIKWYHPAFLIATWFGSGKIPFAPGTMGSFFTFPLFILSHYLLAFVESEEQFTNLYFLCLTLLFFIGQWATAVYMKRTGRHDPKEVVIDEVVGQMIVFLSGFLLVASALKIFPALYGTPDQSLPRPTINQITELFLNSQITVLYSGSILIVSFVCFVLFRIFDIWKPWPIKWCDKNMKTSFGVMFDDIFAAVYAVIALYSFILLFPFIIN